jgi:hypothetical protein
MANDDFIPWVKYPDLSRDRLSAVASLIRNVREDVAKLHDAEAGDGPWGLGCRAYERTCFALEKATAEYPWLAILPDREKPLRFTFAIGNVPFRFYHGDPKDPPSRYLAVTCEEIRQRQLALDLEIPTDTILRIAIETDSTGRASIISVVELDQAKTVTGDYAIPSDSQRTVIPLRAKPVDTPAPTVQRLEDTSKREERNVSGQ